MGGSQARRPPYLQRPRGASSGRRARAHPSCAARGCCASQPLSASAGTAASGWARRLRGEGTRHAGQTQAALPVVLRGHEFDPALQGGAGSPRPVGRPPSVCLTPRTDRTRPHLSDLPQTQDHVCVGRVAPRGQSCGQDTVTATHPPSCPRPIRMPPPPGRRQEASCRGSSALPGPAALKGLVGLGTCVSAGALSPSAVA